MLNRDRIAVSVEITEFLDTCQPGVVKCRLIDAEGFEWIFIEKVPYVTLDDLDENSRYPQPGFVECEIAERYEDEHRRQLCTIDTSEPWQIETEGGVHRFTVFASQLITI